MGWWSNRKTRKQLRSVDDAIRVLQEFHGKNGAELAREGGWDVVAGNDWSWLRQAWQKAGSIWRNYTVRDLEMAYVIASTIHACIRIKCINANQVYMEVGVETSKGWQAFDDHPFYQLMRRPNGGQDRTTFYWDLISHLDSTGESYVWKIRNNARQIIALQPLPTSWVYPRYDSRSHEMTYYELKRDATGSGTRISPDDMLVVRYPNPNDPTQPAGPLQAALRDLQVDDARSDLLIEMLTNIHFPGAILKTEARLSSAQKEDARRKFMDLVGNGKRANPLIADGTFSEIELPKPPADMDWPGTATQAETRICAAFGVPPILIHLRSGLEYGTYSNYGQARKAFYQDTMRSLWFLLADAIERGLFLDEGDYETEILPKFDDIPEMQEDQDKLHGRARADFEGGLIMLDEARSMLGMPELPNGKGQVFVKKMATEFIGPDLEPLMPSLPMPLDEHLADSEIEDDDEDEGEDDSRKPVTVGDDDEESVGDVDEADEAEENE